MILQYIPNILTISRLVLIVPFLIFLYQKEYAQAFYIFFLAGLTDALDGWIARRFNCQSALGSFIDPLADKVLIAVSFISLALIGKLPWWLVILVFLRDITISLGVIAWYSLIRLKITFNPTRLSKLNTLLQLLLVTICLFEIAFFSFFPYFVTVLIWLTALTTAGSYVDYVWTWGKKAYWIAQSNKS
ncbi:CDP-alcohol phosphatidyltransferase family protein [Legionella londiniensis]|uniref:CDP-diacylglycerol--glycerol-3-phosphate 3-phosphatidyltransferase n=1 Tax=Legionella londiniensis TaxID=45068 RepID=A0A0W0VHY9_9GAMM|nr:CDP-alcohol phosphatidyltransferase family protein [Legionella londiniensis]KTD19736.1 phosphatidylglycerophosphate synthase [Legionella londiniensis]STX92353.1 phosphatidylglycerophosphate synthase [Legionella londiniensis]